MASSISTKFRYQLGVEAERNGGEEAEDVAHEDEVVAAGVGVLDDAPVVELVVDDDQDGGHDDAEDADHHHWDVERHGHRLHIRLDDGPVLGRTPLRPPD